MTGLPYHDRFCLVMFFVAQFDSQNTISRFSGPQCKTQSYFFFPEIHELLGNPKFFTFCGGSQKSFAYTKTYTSYSRTLDIRAKKLK